MGNLEKVLIGLSFNNSFFISVACLFYQPILFHPPALSPTNPKIVDLHSGTLDNARNTQRIFQKAEISKSGQLIPKGTSAPFDMTSGTLVINSLNKETLLSPVSGDYYSPMDRDSIQRTRALPPRDYLICVRAYADDDTLQFLLGETCYNPSVMDLNPPILVLPSNGEVVEVPFPTFVWTRPTPLPAQPSYRLPSMQANFFYSALSTFCIQNSDSHHA